MQIHLHKAFFSDDRFLDSLHKSFLNQTTLDLRKEKWTFLNREFTVPAKFKKSELWNRLSYRGLPYILHGKSRLSRIIIIFGIKISKFDSSTSYGLNDLESPK